MMTSQSLLAVAYVFCIHRLEERPPKHKLEFKASDYLLVVSIIERSACVRPTREIYFGATRLIGSLKIPAFYL